MSLNRFNNTFTSLHASNLRHIQFPQNSIFKTISNILHKENFSIEILLEIVCLNYISKQMCACRCGCECGYDYIEIFKAVLRKRIRKKKERIQLILTL